MLKNLWNKHLVLLSTSLYKKRFDIDIQINHKNYKIRKVQIQYQINTQILCNNNVFNQFSHGSNYFSNRFWDHLEQNRNQNLLEIQVMDYSLNRTILGTILIKLSSKLIHDNMKTVVWRQVFGTLWNKKCPKKCPGTIVRILKSIDKCPDKNFQFYRPFLARKFK